MRQRNTLIQLNQNFPSFCPNLYKLRSCENNKYAMFGRILTFETKWKITIYFKRSIKPISSISVGQANDIYFNTFNGSTFLFLI